MTNLGDVTFIRIPEHVYHILSDLRFGGIHYLHVPSADFRGWCERHSITPPHFSPDRHTGETFLKFYSPDDAYIFKTKLLCKFS